MRNTWAIVLVAMMGVLCVNAELRVWTSVKGDTIEAEFIKLMGSKVVLKTAAGKQLQVPVAGLSKKDQEYLASTIPPKLKIEVDMDKDSQKLTQGYDYTRKCDTVSCKVDISKVNQEKCNRDFSATVFLIGETLRGDAHVVLAKTKHSFNFKTYKTTSFDSDSGSCTWYDYYGGKGGTKYEGYLVVIEDSKGNIVDTEANQNFYEKNAAKVLKFGKGDGFSDKCKKVDVSNADGYHYY